MVVVACDDWESALGHFIAEWRGIGHEKCRNIVQEMITAGSWQALAVDFAKGA